MSNLKHMPFAGFVVIVIIGILFLLAVALLFYVYLRYKLLSRKATGSEEDKWGFRARLMAEYKDAYSDTVRTLIPPPSSLTRWVAVSAACCCASVF